MKLHRHKLPGGGLLVWAEGEQDPREFSREWSGRGVDVDPDQVVVAYVGPPDDSTGVPRLCPEHVPFWKKCTVAEVGR